MCIKDNAIGQREQRERQADPYIADGRTVVKIGVESSTSDRNIRGWRKVMV